MRIPHALPSFFLAAFLLVLASGPVAAGETALPENLSDLLAGLKGLCGWELSGKPQYAKGDDLFVLIDGGAEIYMEFGFEQAVLADYKKKTGEGLIVEIYEMSSPQAAYGVYTFKTDKDGKPLDIGGQAKLSDYYLNVWQHRYVITLTSVSRDDRTKRALIEAAQLLSRSIELESEEPLLVQRIRKAVVDFQAPKEMKYLRGNLALANYPVDTRGLFPITQGAVADFGDVTAFVFEFKSSDEAKHHYNQTLSALKKNKKLRSFNSTKAHFSFRNEKDLYCRIKATGNYLLVFQTDYKNRNTERFKSLTTKLGKL